MAQVIYAAPYCITTFTIIITIIITFRIKQLSYIVDPFGNVESQPEILAWGL